MDIMITRIIELIGNEHGSIVNLAKQLGVSRTAFLFLPVSFCYVLYCLDAGRCFTRKYYGAHVQHFHSTVAAMRTVTEPNGTH